MEQELRRMFEMKETEMTVPPVLSPELRNRIGRQRMVIGGLVAAAAVAVVIGGFAGARSLFDDAAPARPAEEKKQEIEPMRNGRIIHDYRGDAFDQDTGSFLYDFQAIDERAGERVRVVGEDTQTIAEFDCPPSVRCGWLQNFGPGPDEVTMLSSDHRFRSVQVIGFDGAVRDTLDISAVVSYDDRDRDSRARGGDWPVDLAWSPDGSRLAISTEPVTDCADPGSDPCEGKVWITDRDGGEPQLVFTERPPDDQATGISGVHPVVQQLAWSPDGRSLGVGVGSYFFENGEGIWSWTQGGPRLIVLRIPPGQPVRADTLHVYERDWELEMTIPRLFDDYFPFAWSPDGSRIAVTSEGGIAEISAEDGEVLARHPGEGVHGPLAWLRER